MNLVNLDEIRRLREAHTARPVDIEEIREHVQRLRGIVLAGAQETDGGGLCDDCVKDGILTAHERRWAYGQLSLCQTHLEPRLRARARHEAQHG